MKKTLILTVLFSISCNTIFAQENSSFIKIKEIKQQENNIINEDLGFIKVYKDIIEKTKPQKKYSEETLFVLDKIKEVEDFYNNTEYVKAQQRLEYLCSNYPSVLLFQKWNVFLLNKINKPEQSLEKLNTLYLDSPLMEKDFFYYYYLIDNNKKLGNYEIAEKHLNLLKESIPNNKTTNNLELIYNYQVNSLQYYQTNTIDKNNIYDLWQSIPKKNIAYLNNYYGFDLSDLMYLYGVNFNKRDLLQKYVDIKKGDLNDNEKLNIKQAQNILSEKY